MNPLLHRVSEITKPIWIRILDNIRFRAVVQADETRMRMQNDGAGRAKNGFVWTFVAADDNGEQDIALVFAADRSGETPRRILQGTTGFLLADAYSGYNDVAVVSTRQRAACHAHLRRYFHEALPTAPVAQEAMDIIAELYRVEHEARGLGIFRTDSHLEFRRQRAGPIRERLRAWLAREQPKHPPKSPIAAAIRYGLNQWTELGRFLDDARIPLGRVGARRGGHGWRGVAVAGLRRCLIPRRGSVSGRRSSNRACRSPAHGSPSLLTPSLSPGRVDARAG
jgi:transposase